MHIEIESKRLKYELDIKGKYSVIQGDSGNGKTNMCRLLQQSLTGDKTIKIQSSIPVLTIAPFDSGEGLRTIRNSIVVLDENYKVLREPGVASILQESDNYFIIIYRKNLDFLPLCVENLYEMQADGRKHWIQPKYTVSGRKNFTRVRHILVEDKVSGFEFFQEHFNVDVVSAKSKSEIVRCLKWLVEMNSEYNDVLIVYDAAAFAYQKEALDVWLDESKLRVQILDWYSFEHYVLTQAPFLINLTQEEIGKKWESLEQAAESQLKNRINYHKGHLPECLKQHSSCNACRQINTCGYKHHAFSPDICINEEGNRMEVF